MMRAAKTATVLRIERCTTIAQFDDVISKQTIEWSSLGAAHAVIYGLAPCASTSDNLTSPGRMGSGVVVRLGLSRWRTHGAEVSRMEQRRELAKPGHCSVLPFALPAVGRRGFTSGYDGMTILTQFAAFVSLRARMGKRPARSVISVIPSCLMT
jgi:hypothetical protein